MHSQIDMNSLLTLTQALLEEHLYPLEPLLLSGNYNDLYEILDFFRNELRDTEIWLPALGAEYGGRGLTLTEFAAISEYLGRSPFGHFVCNVQAPDIGNMELLAQFGNRQQKRTWLKPLTEGTIRSCFGMTEPENAGSNPVLLSSTAEKVANGWKINGHKWFTTGFEGASLCIVMAVTNPDAAPHKRASMFLVPLPNEGVSHVRNIPIMGDVGAGYFSHAEIVLNDCFVPDEALLGEVGAGFTMAQERLGPGRIHHCMRWIGICERVMDMIRERAKHRMLKRDTSLAEQQVVQHTLADLRIAIEASRALVLSTAAKIEQEGNKAARKEISMIKVLTANTLGKVLDYAIQYHGGYGLTDDTMLSFWYRHERAARIYDGPDEVHKNLIARLELR